MKIHTRDELMEMPPGTLYGVWHGGRITEICIKGETFCAGDDWRCTPLDSLESGPLGQPGFVGLDNEKKGRACYTIPERDGNYGYDTKYAVYSDEDVKRLVAALYCGIKDTSSHTFKIQES